MAKEVVRVAKLEFNAGQAKPGPELAGLGIVMPEFTKQFNDQTKDRGSEPVPVEITIYKDKSFTFRLFTAPAAYKLKQAAKIESGSANSKTTIVATISVDQLREIAEYKLVDLNTDNVESAMKIIAGTAKNMGIAIEGWDDIAKLKEEAKAAKIAEQKAHAAEIKLAEDVKHAAEQKEFVEAEVINKKPANEEGEE
ncbi:MAG: 50S ribosomal protein L11 [Mycoplasmataceae bacterium]|nr:50S ribosomal protein L11 [Mycoplasmataceae bacterium]MBR2055610.1 50S ribosomal protein L11 [Mycoplasmataceae bacterium]MBR2999220.1 50S ribosomal protein L11 [Mycoplasmataceae bacterium]MBR3259139.1 50S ribosomal protein L11 [Mycoplasmataceae bacterium]MBR3348051.1 50S ribosomal protein L11 [Mycoplasmataceae bacterium]